MNIRALKHLCIADMMWLDASRTITLGELEPRPLCSNIHRDTLAKNDWLPQSNLLTKALVRTERYICGSYSILWMFVFSVMGRSDVRRHIMIALVHDTPAHHDKPTKVNPLTLLVNVDVLPNGAFDMSVCGNKEGWNVTAWVADEGPAVIQCACVDSKRFRMLVCPTCKAPFCRTQCVAYRSHHKAMHSPGPT